MRRLVLTLLFLLPLVLPLSCGSSDNGDSSIQGEFVVRFAPIEGGCWIIIAPDNTVYGPTNLDNAYRMDGLRVSASLQLLPYTVIVCSGAPVEVVEIAPLP
jgi:hypothetical protein